MLKARTAQRWNSHAWCCRLLQDGRVQLVLLDHGLYRSIDDDFRLQYAGLWHALIFADVEAITLHSTAMNAGHAVPLFAGMLTQRPWDEVGPLWRCTVLLLAVTPLAALLVSLRPDW